eukprot:scaffold172749_cov58-Attheya_sp.AAC.1
MFRLQPWDVTTYIIGQQSFSLYLWAYFAFVFATSPTISAYSRDSIWCTYLAVLKFWPKDRNCLRPICFHGCDSLFFAAEAVKPPAAAAAPPQRAASPPSRGPPAGGVRAANVRADVEAASNQKEYDVSLPMPETYVRCGRFQTTFSLTVEDLLGSRGNGA